MARFNFSSDRAYNELKKIKIIHPHGFLGEFTRVPYLVVTDLLQILEISKEIKIIHEINDKSEGFCNAEFEEANAAILNAEKVIFLGFGFHSDNARRLKVQ